VTHFGQTPSQLLDKPHPRRLPKLECIKPLCADVAQIAAIRRFTPPISVQQGVGQGAVVAISCSGERLVVCHSNLCLAYYRWGALPEDEGAPYTLRADKTRVLPSASLCSSEEVDC
ncbi:hypothetical protein B484DRAFT_410353, partial [Ochromonadaceae sp. CCMP2298]